MQLKNRAFVMDINSHAFRKTAYIRLYVINYLTCQNHIGETHTRLCFSTRIFKQTVYTARKSCQHFICFPNFFLPQNTSSEKK